MTKNKQAGQNADMLQTFYEQTWPTVVQAEKQFAEADSLTWEEKARIIRYGWAMAHSCIDITNKWSMNSTNYEGSFHFWSAEERIKTTSIMINAKNTLANKTAEIWKVRASEMGVSLPEQHGNMEIALLADAELFDLFRFKAV
jgi:hypothetical protein